eukprot:2800498-Rhodomonas_salina.1
MAHVSWLLTSSSLPLPPSFSPSPSLFPALSLSLTEQLRHAGQHCAGLGAVRGGSRRDLGGVLQGDG